MIDKGGEKMNNKKVDFNRLSKIVSEKNDSMEANTDAVGAGIAIGQIGFGVATAFMANSQSKKKHHK